MSALDLPWSEFMRNIHNFSVNIAEAQQATPLMRKSLSGPPACALSEKSAFLPALEESQKPRESERALLHPVTLCNMKTR